MYAILKRNRDSMINEVVDFTSELIRIPSVSLAEGSIANLIERRLVELGYDKVLRDGTGNVLGVMFGRVGEKTILLNNHMDSVPVGSRDEWRSDPFSGELVDGAIYGLGASDCKGGIAAQVYAGALLKRSLLPLKHNVVVSATVAEENGASVGVKALLEKTLPELGLQPSYAVLGEPTGTGLYYGHDGWMQVDILVRGVNPFAVRDTAEYILKNGSELLDDVDGHRQTNVFSSSGVQTYDDGQTACGKISMSRRLVEGEDAEITIGRIRKDVGLIANSTTPVAVSVCPCVETQELYNGRKITVRRIANAWSMDPYHPLVERARHSLKAAGCAVRVAKWELGKLGMGTAGGIMKEQFGLPVIGYGPGNEESAHSPNENVSQKKLIECLYGTAAIAHSLAGVPVCGWTSDEI